MKKTLFAVALLASSSAFAMDVSNPFYVPMKGDVLSETSSIYTNYEDGAVELMDFTETLSYGITRNFSVNGTIADTWVFDGSWLTGTGHDRYDNPAWGLGFKYNLIDCCKTNWKLQLGANYDQGGIDHHDKAFSGFAKLGYQLGNFLPYVTVTGYKPVGRYESDPGIETRVALNTAFSKKVNLDLGVIYDWEGTTKYDGKHQRQWTLDGTLNYVFTDCMSVGLTGAYLLDTEPDSADAYAVGVNFKVAF